MKEMKVITGSEFAEKIARGEIGMHNFRKR